MQYDAIIVGSGPNGLAAGITLVEQGLSVLLLEQNESIGGGLRTEQLTLPGFYHDICASVFPLTVASPFFQKHGLYAKNGLQFIQPRIAAAHPLPSGEVAVLSTEMEESCAYLGKDASHYRGLIEPMLKEWPEISQGIMGPLLPVKANWAKMFRFGSKAVLPATWIANGFTTPVLKSLWTGMAAHSMLPLQAAGTSAIALVMLCTGHLNGWPICAGGSHHIAKTMAEYFISKGGKIVTGMPVVSLEQLSSSSAVLLDVTPRQLMAITQKKLPAFYRWQLQKYRYGCGVFKIDWALSAPIPFRNKECRAAVTVHLGGTAKQIILSEKSVNNGSISHDPFLIVTQPSIADGTRAPQMQHTAWAYCHVPFGFGGDLTDMVESQVEKYAPGFKDTILGRNAMDPAAMEKHNANNIGGDINGGAATLRQLIVRPALRFPPYRTPLKGMYLCSSSTPPGGGVHGMCGFHAASTALKDIWDIDVDPLFS